MKIINVLLVDDNSDKLIKIKSLIMDLPCQKDVSIDVCLDLIEARQALSEKQYDLMALDINLPNRLGEKSKNNGGIELLREINSSVNMKRPLNIIGVTAFDDLKKEYEKEFSDELWAVLLYDETSSLWQSQLKKKIIYLLKMKEDMTRSLLANNNYNYDIAVITALHDPEFKALLNLEANWENITISNDPTSYYRGYFKRNDKSIKVVGACSPQMGMTASTLLSMKLIYNFRPRYLIMIGVTAGIREVGNYGDILVADTSWDYGSGKSRYCEETKQNIFEPDPSSIPLDTDIKEKISKPFEEIYKGYKIIGPARSL